MNVDVETARDRRGIDLPVRLRKDGRSIAVAKLLDEWHGKDHRYFKFLSGEGDLYILRLDEASAKWDLTMFKSSRWPPPA